MDILEQKNRNKQVNVKLDEDTHSAIIETVAEQHLAVVTRKLLMLWLNSEALQRKVRLSTIQSLHELEDHK